MKNTSNKIKIKETVHDIKTKDSKQNLKYFVKDVAIHEKNRINVSDNEKTKNDTTQNYAPNRVEQVQKVTAKQSYRRTKQFIDKKRKRNKTLNGKDIINSEDNSSLIQPKQKEKLISDHKKGLSIDSKNKITTKKHIKLSKTKGNNINSYSDSFQSANTYKKRMKSFMMIKHKNKVKASKNIVNKPIQTGNVLVRTWKSGTYVLTKAVHGISHLWSYGIGLIILVVITLFIGVFACLSDDGGVNSEIEPLSEEVLAYEETITKYAEQFKIEDYVPILEAIMMQESGGKGNDPMQSSESGFNTKYPRKPNGITNTEYSIEVGVQTFSDCLTKSKVGSPADTEKLYLALQGYNYGSGYIEWAVTNFGGYSKVNAKLFSDNKKAELGTDVYGDPFYVGHVMRYYQFAQLGTGNSQLVNVALSQLGNKGGIPYWSWWGYSSRVEWCAIFVSWCSEQCGMLQNGLMPKFENVTVGMGWFKERNQWLPRGIVPNEGMIIFFDWNNDNHCDHVGMVEKAENGIFYTVEGNSNDEVRRNTYSVNSNVIMGYGTIKNSSREFA